MNGAPVAIAAAAMRPIDSTPLTNANSPRIHTRVLLDEERELQALLPEPAQDVHQLAADGAWWRLRARVARVECGGALTAADAGRSRRTEGEQHRDSGRRPASVVSRAEGVEPDGEQEDLQRQQHADEHAERRTGSCADAPSRHRLGGCAITSHLPRTPVRCSSVQIMPSARSSIAIRARALRRTREHDAVARREHAVVARADHAVASASK